MKTPSVSDACDGQQPQAGRHDRKIDPLLLFPTTIGEQDVPERHEGKEPKVKMIEEKGWTAETVNSLLDYRYEVTGDMLTVQGIEVDAKKRAIEAGKIKGVIEKDQQGNTKVYFNDTTENLVKFVASDR